MSRRGQPSSGGKKDLSSQAGRREGGTEGSHLRYGWSRQSTMLRYNRRKFWTELPVKLLYGRSDFQIIPDLPSQLVAKPNMFSKLSQISQNDYAVAEAETDQENWRNSLGSLYRGERLGLATNILRNPWLQLDLDFELFIVLVILQGGEFHFFTLDYFPPSD